MTLSDKKYTIIKKGIDSAGKPFQTRQLKYKQELFDKWEKELAYDFWNLDRTEEGENTRGNERIHTFAKYMNAWEEHFGSLDAQVCNWDGCDVLVYLDSTNQSDTAIRSQVDTIVNFEKDLKEDSNIEIETIEIKQKNS